MFCEECDYDIQPDDKSYAYVDGPVLCAEHAPKLSDSIADLSGAIDGQADPRDWGFKTVSDMRDCLATMRGDLATNGDRSLAT